MTENRSHPLERAPAERLGNAVAPFPARMSNREICSESRPQFDWTKVRIDY
jgi:hypothetical protein